MTNKEAITRLLPKPTNYVMNELDDPPFENNWSQGYDHSLDDSAEKLSKQVVGVEEVAEKIYNTIYEDKKPKQEMSARLECLAIARILTKEFVILKREVK